VLDGRLMPIRAVKIVRLLDDALAKVDLGSPRTRAHDAGDRVHEQTRRNRTDRS
jgi:hypothetical protein